MSRFSKMWSTGLRQGWGKFYAALFPEGRSALATSMAVFLGVFIGVLPTIGIALPLTALAASVCRLPRGPAMVASFIATPPTLFPFFYPLGYFVGRAMLQPPAVKLDLMSRVQELTLFNFADVLGELLSEARLHVYAWFAGTAVVALVTGVLFASLAYGIIIRRTPAKPS